MCLILSLLNKDAGPLVCMSVCLCLSVLTTVFLSTCGTAAVFNNVHSYRTWSLSESAVILSLLFDHITESFQILY